MKQFLIHIGLVLACMFLASCGSKLSPTVLADEILAKYVEMAEVLEEVEDTESARVAAGKIGSIGDDLLQIAAKAEDVDEVTDEIKKRNRQEFIKTMDRFLVVKDKVGRKIANDREAMLLLIKALEEFENKESGLEEFYAGLGLRFR